MERAGWVCFILPLLKTLSINHLSLVFWVSGQVYAINKITNSKSSFRTQKDPQPFGYTQRLLLTTFFLPPVQALCFDQLYCSMCIPLYTYSDQREPRQDNLHEPRLPITAQI